MTILHKFVIDHYQDRPHRGINDVPARLWREAIELNPPALPPHRDDLQVPLAQTEDRTIQHYGIELFDRRQQVYTDLQLGAKMEIPDKNC